MFTRPSDLTDASVADALRSGWGHEAGEIDYAAVGFGSHHWRTVGAGRRWFVTVDDLDARKRTADDTRDSAAARLTAALSAAGALRAAGLDFVVAPEAALTGNVLRRLDDRYAIAVYEHVEGATAGWGNYESRAQRLAVLERLVAIHRASAAASPVALTDDFSIPRRDELIEALADDGRAWGPGPFAEPAEHLLRRHRAAVDDVLARYDTLVGEVGQRRERFVITHGEPHRGNTIETGDGVVLIDWDTALMAPPERDLWMLIGEEPAIADEYAERAEAAVDPAALELYRLWWDLCEVALYIAEFRAPHADTEDTRTAWSGLCEHLDPARWGDAVDRSTPLTGGNPP